MPSSVPVRGRLLLCAALLACGSARAQTVPAPPPLPPAAPAAEETTLSVADFVAYALRYNPDLRAALQNRDVAAGSLAAASAYANPRLEMAQGNNRARLPGVTPGSVTSWSLAQLIENPSLRQSRIDAARYGQQGVEGQVAAATSDLVAQVRLRAYEYLLRREEASAAADALELLEQIRTRVKLRVDSGEAPRYEIIKADAEVINARQKLGAAQLQVDQAAIGLDRLAAGRLPPRWRLAATLGDEQQLPSLGELQQQALDGNPELRVLRSEVQRREARLAEAQASRFPGVELRYGQVRDPEIRQNVLSATVQLPLLDRRTGPIAEATAELARARTQLDGRTIELGLQLQAAAKALDVARLRVSALGTGALPDAEAALRVAQAAYRFGERGILDVLDAQRLLRSIRADLIDARFQLQAAAVQLEQLAGRYAVPESTLSRPLP